MADSKNLVSVGDACDFLEKLAPRNLASEWDNVGLLLGDRAAPVQRILTCLTVTPEVVAEAIQEHIQLIVTHHPIFFRGVKRLTTADTEGKMIFALIRAGIAVYSPHTSYDNAQGGINEILAGKLELAEVGPIRKRDGERQCKIVVFVPEEDLGRVADAIFAAGAGIIGQYSQCTFRLAGIGTFFGSDSTNPTIGQKGRREEVSEWRLEAVCPEGIVETVIGAMRKAHSYEEPAFDVYPLRPIHFSQGEGRLGRLPTETSLRSLAQTIKNRLKAQYIHFVGEAERKVERVAIACGAGGEFLTDAIQAKADVFLTGEMRFHDFLRAQAAGIGLVLPGHYATERIGIEELASRLKEKWPTVKAWASQTERDPVSVV
jgi:dinuclear metal center YbgI/SA1388 family protein